MRCEWKAECCTSPRSQERTMNGRKRTFKLGGRELWPVWGELGILISIGVGGMQLMFPPPARPKALLAGEDLTMNLADLQRKVIIPGDRGPARGRAAGFSVGSPTSRHRDLPHSRRLVTPPPSQSAVA